VVLHYLSFFSVAAVIATALTWIVERIATRQGIGMAAPSDRHIHSCPIPRLGGVAVSSTSLMVFAMYWWMSKRGWIAGATSPQVARVFVIGIAFFAIGLIDDFRTLGPWSKILVEVAGGTALFFCGIHAGVCSGPGSSLGSKLICFLTTVGWVVLICNAINLIDGIDGLAAGAALFSMVTIFTLAVGPRPGIAAATAILAGSMAGFLVFNFNPASIFLGDSGSLFLGFVLSGLVLAESHLQTKAESIVLPILSFALPLTEVAISLLRRFLSGHALFGADREHIHHKLLDLGLTQRQAVAILYGVSALCTLLAIMVQKSAGVMIFPFAAIFLLVAFFGVRKLGYREFSELGRIGDQILRQKRSFTFNVAIRKAAARLNACDNLEELGLILEECLMHDFNAFDIILDQEFGGYLRLPPPWYQGAMEERWRTSEEEFAFKMRLHKGTGCPLGTISLFQNAKRASQIDAELISGAFRSAIAHALILWQAQVETASSERS
jgi:UDP-GlcNAc:undecaprenyl-phosphate/decaprenyl-phosphate GlcNAc-1-phosphate transferase